MLTFLSPKIAKGEWDVVAQLAVQLQNNNIDDAGDEILSAPIEQARTCSTNDEWNLYSFAARCLSFMIPRPKVARAIVQACLQRCISWAADREQRGRSRARSKQDRLSLQKPRELVANLLYAADENRAPVANCIENTLVEYANEGNDAEARAALEIGLHPHYALHAIASQERLPRRQVYDARQN